jgi:hypothetical protein
MKRNDLQTVSQFAREQGVPRDTIYKRIKSGSVKSVTIAGRLFVPKKKETA